MTMMVLMAPCNLVTYGHIWSQVIKITLSLFPYFNNFNYIVIQYRHLKDMLQIWMNFVAREKKRPTRTDDERL